MIENANDNVLVTLLKRGVTKLVEEITEPLVTQDLKLSNNSSYVDAVKKVRHDGRNDTAHSIRLVQDVDPAYETAIKFLEDNISYIFQNHYPNVRKSIEKRIVTASGKQYNALSGN